MIDRFVIKELNCPQYKTILRKQAMSLAELGAFAYDLYVPVWFSYLTGTKIFGDSLLDFSNSSKEEIIDLVLYSPNKIIPIRPGTNIDRYIKHFANDGSFGYAQLIGFSKYYDIMLNVLNESNQDKTINVYVGEGSNINS